MPTRLLIVENDPGLGKPCLLCGFNGTVQCERRIWKSFSFEELRISPIELVIANVSPINQQAIAFLCWLRDNVVQTRVLAVLSEPTDSDLLQIVVQVTDDFILGPAREEEVKLRVSRILDWSNTSSDEIRQLTTEMGIAKLVGQHASFVHAAEQALTFGDSSAAVLITGETGTGKELFAHAIHTFSRRHSGPFIPVDCGALPEHLAENELFGHSRGAFTDARSDQKGLVAMADGGTLFLDEVDALSMSNQAKLLRFLQEGTYRALGAERFSRANTRIIAATNRCLEQCVEQKLFRNDLYFRLNVLQLQLPALRHRPGDISLLAKYFLDRECAAAGSERKIFSAGALRKLEGYHWPGNVRELFNVVQRAFLTCRGRQILADHISPASSINTNEEPFLTLGRFRVAKQRAIEQFERTYIEELLDRHQGNVTRAAREAGKDRRAFGRLIKRHGLRPHVA